MECRLCHEDKELINSHIIPKVFFKFIYPENNEESLIMIGKNVPNKRRPIGSYEKLLYKDCDQMLGVYDNYAQNLLLKQALQFYPNTDLAYKIDDYSYVKLKLFFLSLLWRSSISDLEEFCNIDIGPFEERLEELIRSESVGGADDFSVFIAKFDSENEKIKGIAEKNILFPAKQKINGLNYSIFYLSNAYKIYIKVDKRGTPDVFKELILKDGKSLLIMRLDNFEKSPEFICFFSRELISLKVLSNFSEFNESVFTKTTPVLEKKMFGQLLFKMNSFLWLAILSII